MRSATTSIIPAYETPGDEKGVLEAEEQLITPATRKAIQELDAKIKPTQLPHPSKPELIS